MNQKVIEMKDNTNPKISIIVPAYNVESWLNRCIDSLLCQEYSNLEIIIIDDGSIDNTWGIINDYMKADDRVIGIHQENAGLIEVRNAGIKLASGDYIGFVDGDDSVSNEMYLRLINNAKEHNADISGCGMLYCFETGEPIKHWGTDKKCVFDRDNAIITLITGKMIEPSLCNKIYKKEIIENSCINSEILCNEDLIRNYVAFNRANCVINEDFCGYNYYRRKESMSNNKNAVKTAKDIMDAQELLLGICDKKYYKYFLHSYISHAISTVNKLIRIKTVDADVLSDKCRRILINNKKCIRKLPWVQRIEAIIIIISIDLYRVLYRLAKTQDRRRI